MQEILDQLPMLIENYAIPIIDALVILVLGWILAVWAHRLTLRGLERLRRSDRTVNLIFASSVRYAVLALVFVTALSQLGVKTASILALLATIGLAIGLALQGTLSNVAAGMMLLLLRPFKVGEFIDAEGISGTVDEIGLFTTNLTTLQGIYRSVPNSRLWNNHILNYSRISTRRMEIEMTLPHLADFDAVKKSLLEFANSDERVLESPAPDIMITGFSTTQSGDALLSANFRAWVETGNYAGVYKNASELVKEETSKVLEALALEHDTGAPKARPAKSAARSGKPATKAAPAKAAPDTKTSAKKTSDKKSSTKGTSHPSDDSSS